MALHMSHFLICLLSGILVTGVFWWFNRPELIKKQIDQLPYNNYREKIKLQAQIVTNKELGISFVLNMSIALISILIFVGYLTAAAYDTEILNGKVVDKKRVEVSCSHSYSCPPCWQDCTTDSKGKRSCTKRCSTCYEHNEDYDWEVYSTVGGFEISRIDRQGIDMPPRWNAVVIGEHAAVTHGYQNYLLVGDNDSFQHKYHSLEETLGHTVIEYPDPYDYYRFNRVFNPTSASTSWLNDYLNNYLKEHGGRKQLNLMYLFTYDSRDRFYVTMSKWRGGKKNDLIVYHGLNKGSNKIEWLEANSYAEGMNNRELISELRQISVGQEFNKELADKQLALIDKKFQRIPAENFAYKKNEVRIPFWFTFIIVLLNIASSFGISLYMRKNSL